MRNCTKRKREFRIHEVLSNGQHFNLYLKKRNYTKGGSSEPIHGVWTVALCVSDSRKEANRWYSHWTKLDKRSTGRVGLEALKLAAQYLVDFSHILSFHSEIQISWTDEKRRRAYRRLLRYGFKESDDCFHMRNPEYWKLED